MHTVVHLSTLFSNLAVHFPHTLHIKYPILLSDFKKKLEIAPHIFEKSSNIGFNENSSSVGRVVPWGLSDTIRLIAVFSNFANAP